MTALTTPDSSRPDHAVAQSSLPESNVPESNVDNETIPTLRTQIDAMDAAIIRLVAERTRLSKRIQTARINGGGTRVELGRERVVLDAYRNGLGADGPQLADAILRVGRGAR